ncbi:phosphatase PAP2 family protein [Telmatospirillum sp.]|uniref:phosphatase PAP2 family protein n=1 Tax=Telmatospirillum sp. TaxID=2079197 RepID=UPI00284E273D|nr:phosphatase PAP2 family protein [Telmatospirillum sp.]MDR3437463.1 phosphatase PAP2 family protein [Telmatospirillum sp.]
MLPDRRRLAQTILITSLAGALVTLGAVLLLDRPISQWSHAHLHGMQAFLWLTRIAEPAAPLALGGACGLAVAWLCGWQPGRGGRVLLALCLATLLALGIKEELKYAIGRTWPETWTNGNPSWIGNGVFAMEPFHGGAGWASFPSGHTSVVAAPMGVLWFACPRWRLACVLPVFLVAIGLLGADYHWLSDIIGGSLVGMASAVGALAAVETERR